MFYGPCGLFYNAGLFEEKGWDVPTTWDEMWALGDKAKEEGIALFTYPTTGYFDAFFYALMHETMGDDFSKALTYEDGIWDTEGAKQAFDIVAKLATYTEKTTPANANDNDFRKNQQLVLDNKALFMPNGNWVIGEMEDAPRADGFEWGSQLFRLLKKAERELLTHSSSRSGCRQKQKSRISEKNLSLTCTLMKQLRSSSIKAEQFSRSKECLI